MNKQPEKTVGCIVMASGKGERFGENKLLARLAGREMLLYVIDAVRTAAFSEILVVTRHSEVREIVRDAYGPADGCPPVRCVLYPGGPQSETVKRGLSEMLSYDACLFAAGDQPLLRQESVSRMVETYRRRSAQENGPDPVCRLSFEGKPGNPVLFPARYYPRLMEIRGDRGGGQILKDGTIPVVCIEAEDPMELMDVDRKEDLQRAEEYLRCGTVPRI
ncbi:MAG: nucleotidyltransferase family protein [Lachnospiraceae bacterium]|nr:nucleotidyltransferase family protein [Lachnospiraceae bacterium]